MEALLAENRGAANVVKAHRAFWFVAIVGIAFAVGVWFEVSFLNGPWYWKWPWQNLGLLRTAGFCLLAAPPFVAAMVLIEDKQRGRWHVPVTLLLLFDANVMLQIGGMLSHPDGFARLEAIVRSAVATSYFTDALSIGNVFTWLANFDPRSLTEHSMTHPPGPILFYYFWQRMAGPLDAASLGGAAVGLLAACGIPVMYSFAGLWRDESNFRLRACALYALSPALVVFLPEFDQVYPILSMAMLIGWAKSLDGDYRFAALFVGVLVVALLFAYNLLVVGSALVFYSAYFVLARRQGPPAWRRILVLAAVSTLAVIAVFLLIWAATGYNAVLAFRHAIGAQAIFSTQMDRPYWFCLIFGPYDFFLGCGMIVLPLLVIYFYRLRGAWKEKEGVLSLIGLASLIVIDVSGLLPGETARDWLFMQPFVIVPAALVMGAFSTMQRLSLFFLQWCTVVVLTCKMAFILP